MFRKVLVANRGEIACRVIRTLRRLGVASVAVYSDADRYSPHVSQADEAVRIGPEPVAESYVRQDRLIAAAKTCGAEAIHPGYGFLSESAPFAEACEAAGLVFVGPTPAQIRDFGLKHRAREIAGETGVPLLPGSGLLVDADRARQEAARIGYPLMLKSTAGGGGIGLSLVPDAESMASAFGRVDRLARKNFSRGGVFIERFIEHARHIEVQIFGDGKGRVMALGERDCSVQRRHQKLIEETPAPGLTPQVRGQLHEAAVRLGESVSYRSAGTVEFVYDADRAEFFFLEVNTRLQVEHGVTEAVTGIDLVEWMLRVAAGDRFELTVPPISGSAIEVRVYAEDPAHEFRPSTGLLTHVSFPNDIRVDSWVGNGTVVTPYYDPLLAKMIVHGADRNAAVAALRRSLDASEVAGIETNLDFLRQFVATPSFSAGGVTTRALDSFAFDPRTIEVLAPGTQTTVQDYPGRLGHWDVGVPPSGPMDSLSFRLANRAVGNPSQAAALEITVSGPTLRFNTAMVICLTGAAMSATLDGAAVDYWKPVEVGAGSTLAIGAATGPGCRAYLAVRGGIDVPCYMGSRSTFTLGRFGGHGGRALVPGDQLHLCRGVQSLDQPTAIPSQIIPRIGRDWELAVLYGPHGAPDFFTEEDIEVFFASSWAVHYHSSRTGVRLLGPKPKWARTDGGEAGLHPSNIHDNAYAIGAVDFTGDMPVILGPDGPSLGGFVCPATLVTAELWKLGQLRPDDQVRFKRLTADEARALDLAHEAIIHELRAAPSAGRDADTRRTHGRGGASGPILETLPADGHRPRVVYRRAGDRNLLIEYGEPVLDLELRLRAHALMQWIGERRLNGVLDLTPGIRSLQVHYDPHSLPTHRLLDLLVEGERSLGAIDDAEIPTRIVRLPLSWDDPETRLAIDKYMQSVRSDAPWCPSNIEFIRRINGLASIEQVKDIVFGASYLVLGLGDVYLGAPVATPLDPRHRLITTKYNPARTWTPENAVGIGGAYLCVYGMEGPGGYQFVGRTCQMWSTYKVTPAFASNKPWLLRFFDQIQFFPVTAEQLREFRADFAQGCAHVDMQDEVFSLARYRRFLSDNEADIRAHKQRQQAAFEAERGRWEANVQEADLPGVDSEPIPAELEAGCIAVASPVAGSVWRVETAAGQHVRSGETLLLVESMKMELPVTAPVSGRVVELRCSEGRTVVFAQTLVVLRADGC
jgi:urea carboxylase